MTKSRMKGWIVALAALAVIGTAGTATAGYLTKGFREWNTQEKQTKPEEKQKEDKTEEPADGVYTERPAIPKGAAGLARPSPKRAAIPSAFSSASEFVSSLTEVGTADLASAPSYETSMPKGL